jgi:hypothetical protein
MLSFTKFMPWLRKTHLIWRKSFVSIETTTTSMNARRSSGPSRKPFTIEEDARLIEAVNSVDPSLGWDHVARQMNGRTVRQCRERWIGYLSPAIRTEPWTEAEDQLLVTEMSRLGHKWTVIARRFNGRSGSDVKNRWYSHLKDVCVLGSDGKYELCRVAGRKRKRKFIGSCNVFVDPDEAIAGSIESWLHLTQTCALFHSFMDLPPLRPRGVRVGDV